jgi:hypothetical protein
MVQAAQARLKRFDKTGVTKLQKHAVLVLSQVSDVVPA